MKNLTPYLIITILVLIILLMLKDCKGKPDTETEYVYKTDSLYKDKYFKLKEEFDKKTPPKTVTIWKQSPPKIIIDSIKYVPGEILVYIEGLKETLRIKEDYIKLYPHNDKLLEFNLTRDKLDITTLNTDAQIITKEYPLFLNKYKYRWINNELTHEDDLFNQKKKLNWKQLYFNYEYTINQQKSLIGFEYNLEPGRFKIDLESKFTIEEKPSLYLNAKIGYLLFK